jgi:hypothetical protein
MPITIKTIAPPTDKPLTRKIFIYGIQGSGKTELAGSAQSVPEMADVLVGSIDGGEATLSSRGDVLGTVTRNVSDVEELLYLLIRKDPSVKGIRTLCLDGGSEMQKKDLADIAAVAAQKKESRDKDLNELQDYKLNMAKMLRIIRMARDIPDINLIMTFWANMEFPVGPNGQPAANVAPTRIFPDLSKGVAKVALGYFDDAFYLEKSKTSEQRILYTGEVKGIVAKTRDRAVAAELSTTNTEGKVLPYIVNPTFTDIYARYKKAYKLA